VDEMFAGIEGVFKGSWNSREKVTLRQNVSQVRNLHEHESTRTKNSSDLYKEGARILDVLKHVD